jgi:hypothetical protein
LLSAKLKSLEISSTSFLRKSLIDFIEIIRPDFEGLY